MSAISPARVSISYVNCAPSVVLCRQTPLTLWSVHSFIVDSTSVTECLPECRNTTSIGYNLCFDRQLVSHCDYQAPPVWLIWCDVNSTGFQFGREYPTNYARWHTNACTALRRRIWLNCVFPWLLFLDVCSYDRLPGEISWFPLHEQKLLVHVVFHMLVRWLGMVCLCIWKTLPSLSQLSKNSWKLFYSRNINNCVNHCTRFWGYMPNWRAANFCLIIIIIIYTHKIFNSLLILGRIPGGSRQAWVTTCLLQSSSSKHDGPDHPHLPGQILPWPLLALHIPPSYTCMSSPNLPYLI